MLTDLEQNLKQHGFDFAALQQPAGLQRLDAYFTSYLKQRSADLFSQLQHYRQLSNKPAKGNDLSPASSVAQSEFLIALACELQEFLADMFALQNQLKKHRAEVQSKDAIFIFKDSFVKRFIKKKDIKQSVDNFTDAYFVNLHKQLMALLKNNKAKLAPKNNNISIIEDDLEIEVATYWVYLQENKQKISEEEFIKNKTLLHDWCLAAICTTAGRELTAAWVSLQLPTANDFTALVKCDATAENNPKLQAGATSIVPRQGFDLENTYLNDNQIADQVHYCILCHKNNGDFCSHGFPQKKTAPELGLRSNPLEEILTGCPLEERISEMNALQRSGNTLAALAMLMRDNPLCPLTGHRICNDCMLACIYQKQRPVDIPQIETSVLMQILDLPWGVELYQLLVLWNPLRVEQWCLQDAIQRRVMVMGMGPAGMSMAHYLSMAGCEVLAVDGLQIEKLNNKWLQQPIKSFSSLNPKLSERTIYGFGGVAEYGITSRWNKNLLSLVYISLARRGNFQLVDAVRFGGQLTVQDAWYLGCDHLSLAVGAGLPREMAIKNSLAPGMRQASDFLMTLQLNAAYRFERLVDLEVSLPAVVIGGGLTAVDSACEAQAYYIEQVVNLSKRYQTLEKYYGADKFSKKLQQAFQPHQLSKIKTMLQHAAEINQEKKQAELESRPQNFIPLVHAWGGVTLIYRRNMQDSPAYKRNHEELSAALAQGIIYRQALQPVSAKVDANGFCVALDCKLRLLNAAGQWESSEETLSLPANCILVATGAMPNVAYEYEHRGSFNRLHNSYQSYDLDNNALAEDKVNSKQVHCKQKDIGVFTSYADGEPNAPQRVSFIGDTHPVFHGSVVKAMASAKRTYPQILQQLSRQNLLDKSAAPAWLEVTAPFAANIITIKRLHAMALEIVIKAPLAAKAYFPGALYRLQTYAADASRLGDTLVQAEPLALTAAKVTDKEDCLSFVIFEDTLAARMVASWRVGQRLALMGPTGASCAGLLAKPGELLIAGDANAALFLRAIGPFCKATVSAENDKAINLLIDIKYAKDAIFVAQLQQYSNYIIWCLQDSTENKDTQNLQDLALREGDKIYYGSLQQFLEDTAENKNMQQLLVHKT